jgi:Zn finger protein HypA/HybF involved in hydrogenase expression
MPLTVGRAGEYQCRNCEEEYDVQHHVCPNCRSFSVDSVDDVTRNHRTSYF